MIFLGAATLAYDENEIHLDIETEEGESILLGDIITIPMNDHSFEKRKVVGIFKNWKKWRDGKSLDKVCNGETATVAVNGIHSGMVHTISSFYIDEELGDDYVTALLTQRNIDFLDYTRWSDKPEKYKHRLIVDFLKQEITIRNSITGTENMNRYSVEYDPVSFANLIRDTGISEYDSNAHFADIGKKREGFICKCKIRFHDGKIVESNMGHINTDNPLEKVLLWLRENDERLDLTWFI